MNLGYILLIIYTFCVFIHLLTSTVTFPFPRFFSCRPPKEGKAETDRRVWRPPNIGENTKFNWHGKRSINPHLNYQSRSLEIIMTKKMTLIINSRWNATMRSARENLDICHLEVTSSHKIAADDFSHPSHAQLSHCPPSYANEVTGLIFGIDNNW